MEQYLIDTSVISDYFSSLFSVSGMQLMDAAIDAGPKLSVITQIELLCCKTDIATEQKVKDFINDSIILNISEDIVLRSVKIRKGKKIKTPDVIIAATALAYEYTLITNNERDFSILKG